MSQGHHAATMNFSESPCIRYKYARYTIVSDSTVVGGILTKKQIPTGPGGFKSVDVNNICNIWTNGTTPSKVYTLTPLTLAVRYAHRDVVKTLLQLGANPYPNCDITPIGVAVLRNDIRLVSWLRNAGADINQPTHIVWSWKPSNGEGTASVPKSELDVNHLTALQIAFRFGYKLIASLLEVLDLAFDKQLTVACAKGRTAEAISLMKYPSCLVNGLDLQGNTALYYASLNGDYDVAEQLIKNGARVHVVGQQQSPLAVAAMCKDRKMTDILVQADDILAHGSELFTATSSLHSVINCEYESNSRGVNRVCYWWPNYEYKPDRVYRVTPLTVAAMFASRHVVRKLLQLGADPNIDCDLTPLGAAVDRNNIRLVAMLLNAGANIDQLTHSRFDRNPCFGEVRLTPSQLSCRLGLTHEEVRRFLELMRTEKIYNGKTTGRFGMQRLILGFRSWVLEFIPDNESEIISACLQGNMEKVSSFVSADPQLCQKIFKHDNTLLHFASMSNNFQLIIFLVQLGSVVNRKNDLGQRPIDVAFRHGNLEAILAFLEIGCEPPRAMLSARNSRGNTLLHIACKKNKVGTVVSLLLAGASLVANNTSNKTPLHFAWKRGINDMLGVIVLYVFKLFMDIDSRTGVGLQRAACTLCGLHQVVVQSKNIIFFHVPSAVLVRDMCMKFNGNVLEFILMNVVLKVDDLVRDCRRECLAELLIILRRYFYSAWQSSTTLLQFIQTFVKSGADPCTVVDDSGNTWMHLACSDGRKDTVEVLLKHGGDPLKKNAIGNSALKCAFDNDQTEIVKFLTVTSHTDASSILTAVNMKGNTFLRMIYSSADSETFNSFVEMGARINVFPAVRNSGSPSTCLLNQVLADGYYFDAFRIRRGEMLKVKHLIEIGCQDYSDADGIVQKIGRRYWLWLRLAGFPSLNFPLYWSTSSIDVHDDIDNSVPPSLQRFCIIAIRQRLVETEPDGKSIFPAVDQLPLPARLKVSLKLADLPYPDDPTQQNARLPQPFGSMSTLQNESDSDSEFSLSPSSIGFGYESLGSPYRYIFMPFRHAFINDVLDDDGYNWFPILTISDWRTSGDALTDTELRKPPCKKKAEQARNSRGPSMHAVSPRRQLFPKPQHRQSCMRLHQPR